MLKSSCLVVESPSLLLKNGPFYCFFGCWNPSISAAPKIRETRVEATRTSGRASSDDVLLGDHQALGRYHQAMSMLPQDQSSNSVIHLISATLISGFWILGWKNHHPTSWAWNRFRNQLQAPHPSLEGPGHDPSPLRSSHGCVPCRSPTASQWTPRSPPWGPRTPNSHSPSTRYSTPVPVWETSIWWGFHHGSSDFQCFSIVSSEASLTKDAETPPSPENLKHHSLSTCWYLKQQSLRHLTNEDGLSCVHMSILAIYKHDS